MLQSFYEEAAPCETTGGALPLYSRAPGSDSVSRPPSECGLLSDTRGGAGSRGGDGFDPDRSATSGRGSAHSGGYIYEGATGADNHARERLDTGSLSDGGDGSDGGGVGGGGSGGGEGSGAMDLRVGGDGGGGDGSWRDGSSIARSAYRRQAPDGLLGSNYPLASSTSSELKAAGPQAYEECADTAFADILGGTAFRPPSPTAAAEAGGFGDTSAASMYDGLDHRPQVRLRAPPPRASSHVLEREPLRKASSV